MYKILDDNGVPRRVKKGNYASFKICSKCGEKMPVGANYCSGCGTKFLSDKAKNLNNINKILNLNLYIPTSMRDNFIKDCNEIEKYIKNNR